MKKRKGFAWRAFHVIDPPAAVAVHREIKADVRRLASVAGCHSGALRKCAGGNLRTPAVDLVIGREFRAKD